MKILYIMDPMSHVLPDKDTTFAFQRAAQGMGHSALHAEPKDIYAHKGQVYARARTVTVSEAAPFFALGNLETVALAAVDAVFIRKDPPFDAQYLYLTLLLEQARGQTLIVNDPRGLRDANEKLYTLHFTEFMPETLVASSQEQLLAFVLDVGGKAVIKPLDGAGGAGVMMLDHTDRNRKAIVENLTAAGSRLAMVQKYVPGVVQGDKRILLLEGEPLGAINRVPMADDLRSNIHVGGRVEPCEVTASERAMIQKMKPKLLADGLVFVGLDVINGNLTEVNVTSPTGIQELSRHMARDVAKDVIDWVERRVKSAPVKQG
jgi:glutathione synthase